MTTPDGMLRLVPGLVRAPDVAFVSWGRIAEGTLSTEAIGGFAPDLAVEVLSPGNTKSEMARKRREYFGAGVRLVWEVNPRARTVDVYESPEHSIRLGGSQALEGGAYCLGSSCRSRNCSGNWIGEAVERATRWIAEIGRPPIRRCDPTTFLTGSWS